MKSALILFCLLATSLQAMADEQFDERIPGKRFGGKHRCGIGHLTLKQIPDEILVADFFPTKDERDEDVSDMGNLVVNGLDFQTYKRIIYSNESISATIEPNEFGPYAVSVEASTSGQLRTVKLAMSPSSANYHPKELTIIVQQNKMKEMTLVEKKSGFFGGYKTIFKDTCVF